MAERAIIEIQKILPELFKGRGIRIEKIILFGSYAENKQKDDSDIDLIVVSEDFREKNIFERVKMTRGIHRKLVKEINNPLDLLFYSDEEWNKGHSLMISAAKETGKIIYG